jgi:hypothetical protein
MQRTCLGRELMIEVVAIAATRLKAQKFRDLRCVSLPCILPLFDSDLAVQNPRRF